MQLKNPKLKLEITLRGDTRIIDEAEMYFSVDKDLSEDENSAEFTVYNLAPDMREFMVEAGNNDAPIKFFGTTVEAPGGAYAQAFAGEIENVEDNDMRPGFESIISCTSQKRNHRDFWFQKTYSSGTNIDEIISGLKGTINLPDGNTWETSSETIILSKSFAGPAYQLLQRLMFDRGLYCYIMDGKIYSSLVSVAPAGIVNKLDDMVLRGDPRKAVRTARNLIEMKTVIEVTGKLPDALLAESTRKRRKNKKLEVYGQNDLVEFEAVDQKIQGMNFPLFFQPHFNPDNMFSYGGQLFRCQRLHHEGDNFGGDFDTDLECDIYDDTGGDFIGQI